MARAEKHAAEPLAFDTLVVASPALAARMWSVAQGLPKISGSFVHLFRRVRLKPSEAFAMEMSIFGLYRPGACGLWLRPWSGFGKKSPARRIKEKEDYRDAEPLTCFLFS